MITARKSITKFISMQNKVCICTTIWREHSVSAYMNTIYFLKGGAHVVGPYRWSRIALMWVGKQQKFRKGRRKEGRKKEERKKEKLIISSPVTVLSNHSSSSSAWPKPIQFQFRFSQTNPVPFRFTIMLDESEWESYCEERAGDPEDLRFSYCKIPEVATLLMQGMVSVDTIGLDQ